MYKEELCDIIDVCKMNTHKRYIWENVHTQAMHIYIVGCYIPHKESNFYDNHGLDKMYPFHDICTNKDMYAKCGDVMVMGDMIGRLAHAQI